jgi:hypothetical protein
MSSAFISIAAALPEGHDAAASALFVLGKSSLKDPVTLHHTLDPSVVRAAKRDTVAAAVSAVSACRDAAALAAHQGDSRVSVQRALGANEHTPPKTLEWLLRAAIQRNDSELFGNIAHRVPLPAFFEALEGRRVSWQHVDECALAKPIVSAGEDWAQRAVNLGHNLLTASVIAETINQAGSFEDLVRSTNDSYDRLLAIVVDVLGYVHKDIVTMVLASDPRAFVDECSRRSRRPILGAAEHVRLASALGDTPRRTAQEALFAAFRPDEYSKDLFLETLRTGSQNLNAISLLTLLPVCSPQEIHEVVSFMCSSGLYTDQLYATLPSSALPATRELVCSFISPPHMRRILTGKDATNLTRGELAAMVSTPERASAAIKYVAFESISDKPWYHDFMDMLGPHLLRLVSRDRDVAAYVAQRFVEAFGEDADAVVFGAKLINDGFVGTISELVTTVLVVHPPKTAAPTETESAEEPEQLGYLEQLELFA